MSVVGMGVVSMTDFYNSEPREIELVLEGNRLKQENDFYLMQTAMTNSIGVFMQKNFKPTNPFKKQSKENKKIEPQTKRDTLDYLVDKLGGEK